MQFKIEDAISAYEKYWVILFIGSVPQLLFKYR